MGSCCPSDGELEQTAKKHRKILWMVLIINALMFFVELTFGVIGDSLALVGDSLDMLGDAVTYGSSLAVVGMGPKEKASVAKLKASIMLFFGLAIAARSFYKAIDPVIPDFSFMVSVGSIALIANLFCLFLLTRHRDDDINMKSVWVCSRNDIVANVSVLVAAAVVFLTKSPWPDLAVGFGLTVLFLSSAIKIFKDANLAVGA
ncbi:MAG: cation transporter [Bdellovibrionota bacterium]